jgi:hypothetical protein
MPVRPTGQRAGAWCGRYALPSPLAHNILLSSTFRRRLSAACPTADHPTAARCSAFVLRARSGLFAPTCLLNRFIASAAPPRRSDAPFFS